MLITILIACIVFGLLFYLVQKLPLESPWNTIVLVILIIIAIAYFARFLGVVI